MTAAKTPEELYSDFVNMAEATARHTFFEDAIFENMTIKEAKDRAATMAAYTIRFARDYHSSMTYAEGSQSGGNQ